MAVDCDFHTGSPAGSGDRPGLAELLSGAAAFSNVVMLDKESPLQLIPAGRERTAAAPLIASARFDAVIEALEQNYEMVLMNLGAGSPETVPLAVKGHATLLVASGERAQDAALFCASLAASGVRAARFVIVSHAEEPIALRA
jgi:MinD-like ATPase involved in chromosome partitioning or flagellar assembly